MFQINLKHVHTQDTTPNVCFNSMLHCTVLVHLPDGRLFSIKNQVNNLGKDQLVQCSTTITDESLTIYNYVIYHSAGRRDRDL